MRYAVKAREVGKKKWKFIAPNGALSSLRIYASRWAEKEKAENFIAVNAGENPGWEFKVVDIGGDGG